MKKSLTDFGIALSRDEAKRILGGNGGKEGTIGGGGGATFCRSDNVLCYTVGETNYYCSTHWESEVEQCCCGHDSGNSVCEAT